MLRLRWMTSSLHALTILTLLCLTQSTEGQEQTPQHQAKAQVKYDSQQQLGKGVTLARMNNGMTVIVQENHAAPVATVRSYVKNTGSVYEGEWLGAGLSHLAEHLISGGTTTKRKEPEIRAIIDSMGGRTNAYTSNNITAYYIDCPSSRTAEAIELIADSMQHITFENEEYLREMGVVQRELEMGEADRNRVGYQAMKESIFSEHPMRHPIIGHLSVLQGITRDDIVNFYKSRYTPQNMIFVVVGDVQTDEVLKEVLDNFQGFHRHRDTAPTLVEEPQQASPRTTRIEMPGETTQFSIAWPTVALQHADLYPLDVASYLLTTGDSSRITKRLKVDEPLAISVSSASYTPGFVNGWFQIEVECAPENVQKCKRIIFEEVGRLKQQPVNEKELAKVKRQKAAEHVFGQQTVQDQAESLGRSYLSTNDPLFDEQYVKGIERVTPEQIQAVARRYFRPERENTVYIVPQGSQGEAASGGLVAAESDVIRKVLPNGLTLLVKRHAVQPLVTMQVFVNAGIISDTDEKSGRAALATSVMDKGTDKYTADQIAEYFDSIGGAMTVSSQRNSSYLTCATLSDDFPTALDYCHQVLFHPTFPAAEFKKQQQQALTRIAARKANPQAEILDYWTTQLPKTTPFHRTVLGTEETVAKLSVDDCREFHRTYFAPNNMVVAVYGDIDPDATLKSLEARFGGYAKSDVSFPDFADAHFAKKSQTSVLRNQQQGTSMVLMSYPSVSVHAEKERAALQVLSGVLTGGGGAGGRLFEELRGARLVYYVFGFEMTGPPPGYYLFMAQTRPETANEVVQRIQANIEKIRNEGIPADELKATQQKLIAQESLRNTTPGEQAFQAALNELYGLGYNYDAGYADRVNAVTSDDVQAVVAKFFTHPLVITSQPESAE